MDNNQDNLSDILEELNRVLSGLKDDKRRAVQDEFLGQQPAAETQSPAEAAAQPAAPQAPATEPAPEQPRRRFVEDDEEPMGKPYVPGAAFSQATAPAAPPPVEPTAAGNPAPIFTSAPTEEVMDRPEQPAMPQPEPEPLPEPAPAPVPEPEPEPLPVSAAPEAPEMPAAAPEVPAEVPVQDTPAVAEDPVRPEVDESPEPAASSVETSYPFALPVNEPPAAEQAQEQPAESEEQKENKEQPLEILQHDIPLLSKWKGLFKRKESPKPAPEETPAPEPENAPQLEPEAEKGAVPAPAPAAEGTPAAPAIEFVKRDVPFIDKIDVPKVETIDTPQYERPSVIDLNKDIPLAEVQQPEKVERRSTDEMELSAVGNMAEPPVQEESAPAAAPEPEPAADPAPQSAGPVAQPLPVEKAPAVEPAPAVAEEAPRPITIEEPAPADAAETDGNDDGTTFHLACYYEPGGSDQPGVFLQNLTDIVKKTTKKQYAMTLTIRKEVDFSSVNVDELLADCRKNRIDAAFFLTDNPPDLSDRDLFCRPIAPAKVAKRFLYVDLVVELMLLKKTGA